jgi:hypothetical protein
LARVAEIVHAKGQRWYGVKRFVILQLGNGSKASLETVDGTRLVMSQSIKSSILSGREAAGWEDES